MEEDYDELPQITVNTPRKFKTTFTMPPADVLASERARESECERQLELLRKSHASEEEALRVGIARSDSSGSDGENSLAATVDNLRVPPDIEAAPTSPTTPKPTPVELISKLLQHLPENDSNFIRDYLEVLQQGNSAMTKSVTYEVLEGLEAAVVSEQCAWDGASIVCCCAWVCTLAVGGEGVGMGLRLRRTLHALLQRATDHQVETLSHVMSETLASPQLLLELSDAVQGTPGASTSLAHRLLQIALDRASSAEGAEGEGVAARVAWARLWGRVASRGTPPPLPPHALQPPPDASHADRLKLEIEASKLKLLFQDKKGQEVNRN